MVPKPNDHDRRTHMENNSKKLTLNKETLTDLDLDLAAGGYRLYPGPVTPISKTIVIDTGPQPTKRGGYCTFNCGDPHKNGGVTLKCLF